METIAQAVDTSEKSVQRNITRTNNPKEQKMRRTRTTSAIITLIFVLSIFIPTQAMAASKLKFAHIFANDSLEDKMVQKFAKQVEKRTNGEIEITDFSSGQLGDILGGWQGLQLGTIDLSFVDITLLGYLKGHEDFLIGQVPYLFNSQEDANRIYASDLFQPLYDKLIKDKGIRVLAASGERAPRSFNTTKGPIFSMEDCTGIKIRVLPNAVSIKSFEAWGFKPTPVNWNELFMALKQGIVDGQDNGLDVTVPNKFYEVAKYYAFSNHVHSVYGWYVSEKTWNKIPEKYRAVLKEEAQAAGDELTKLGRNRQLSDLDEMLKTNVKVTIPNRFQFREASKNVYKEFEGKLWPEGMVEKIRAAQK